MASASSPRQLYTIGGLTTLGVNMAPQAVAEPVALHLRDHQVELDEWSVGRNRIRVAELVRELHRFIGIFNFEFKLELPNYPTVGFAALRNAYATYGADRCHSQIGTIDNITFNSKELTRDTALILRTLLHELLHLWQAYHGRPSPSNYHNAEYRKKALDCGLIVTPQGCTNGHTEVFTAVLAKAS